MAELVLETLPDIVYEDIKLTSVVVRTSIDFNSERALSLPQTFTDADVTAPDPDSETPIPPPVYIAEAPPSIPSE